MNGGTCLCLLGSVRRCPIHGSLADGSMTIEQSIEALWDICDVGWWMRAVSDQWWQVRVACLHGEWVANSHGSTDLSTAFATVVSLAATGHARTRGIQTADISVQVAP